MLIPELGKGGAQRSLSKLAMALSKQHEVHVVTFHSNYQQVYELPVKPIALGELASSKLSKISQWRKRIKSLKSLKSEYKIDVCISFLEGANYINVLTRKDHKTILSVRGSKQFDHKISGFSGWVRKKILIPRFFKKADKVVCVSDGIADEMRHFFGLDDSRLRVIKNFYNLEKIQQDSEQAVAPEITKAFSKPCIAFSGRLDVQKEPLGLLTAFAKLKTRKDVRLLLLGDGVLKDQIEAKSKVLNLSCGSDPENDVVLLGYQTNPFAIISKCQLFALSSSWEGFPNSLAEAILCRVPVISADCPTGPREIFQANVQGFDTITEPIRTDKGVLMPLLNTGDEKIARYWAEEMEQLLEQDTSVQVETAFQFMSTFTHDRIMSSWEEEVNK